MELPEGKGKSMGGVNHCVMMLVFGVRCSEIYIDTERSYIVDLQSYNSIVL